MPNINKPNQHFDVITYTGNGKAVTVVGNAQISTAQSKWGGSSASFDGAGDSLNTPDSPDFAFGSGDFTVEFWVRFNAVNTRQVLVTQINDAGSTANCSISLQLSAAFKWYGSIVSGTTLYEVTSSGSPSANIWYHYAFVRNANTITLYIDGSSVGSASVTGVSVNDSADLFKIGNYTTATTGGYPFNGYIDDLRVYKGVAKYTANFTPPTVALPIGPTDPYWQYCVLAMPMDGTNASTTFPTFAYNAATDSGLGFRPDLVWIKGRSGATDHALYDAVRGVTKDLVSNSAAAETTQYGGLGAFNANGFTVGNLAKVNTSAATYAAWCWKAGNSTSTNTAGSITSTVSVNPTAGFSVQTWTAQSSGAATVGHGIGSAPSFILTKSLDEASGAWVAYHKSTGKDQVLYMSLANAAVAAAIWNNVEPTSTVFGLGSGYAGSGRKSSYCWAEVPGFSSFGSYTGNGNANGPFINLGFRPALLIIKCSSATGNWVMLDDKRAGYNVDNDPVWANLATAEGTTDLADLLSNGFKIRTTDASVNTNAATYVYAAWAEVPSKYSLGR